MVEAILIADTRVVAALGQVVQEVATCYFAARQRRVLRARRRVIVIVEGMGDAVVQAAIYYRWLCWLSRERGTVHVRREREEEERERRVEWRLGSHTE